MSLSGVFWAAPPVARTLTAATLATSLAVHSSFLSGYYVVFLPYKILQFAPQLWRLVTPFLLTRRDMSVLFDTYFIWTYSNKLESSSPRFTRAGDFFTYLLFICTVIMGLNWAFTGGIVFNSALILALVYTAGQDDRAGSVNFYVISIPAPVAPYAILLLTLVSEGIPGAMVQATGLVAAHLYEFLTKIWPELGDGPNILQTPAVITRFFSGEEPTETRKAYGSAFAPGQPSQGKSSSTSSGVLPDSWRSRGTGHRLGGD